MSTAGHVACASWDTRAASSSCPRRAARARGCGPTASLDETTFLDAVHLEVNGARVAPRDCVGEHCAADGSYTRLVQGQHLRLEFDVSGLSGDARLIAEGYYVPR